jgi:hypothetical protein
LRNPGEALYNPSVRRASAICALSAICYAWIAPLALADSEANLPACCRRNGAHHCSMKGSMPGEMQSGEMEESVPSTDGTAFYFARQCCPACPGTAAASNQGPVAVLRNSAAIFAGLVSHPSIQPQTEARYRVAFSRSRQKRGPPVVLS